MNSYTPSLKKIYLHNVLPKLIKNLELKNVMEAPKIMCVNVSMCLGDSVNDLKTLKKNKDCLEKICGQKVVITKVKKSISAFKIRANMFIGLKVTLRKNIMWEFLDRFINIALPRVKDFKGITSNFDSNGNITIGIKENLIFPELDYKDIDKVRGLNITISTSSRVDSQAKMLLMLIGIPLR
jgi:large subunit ribosomal protein L5